MSDHTEYEIAPDGNYRTDPETDQILVVWTSHKKGVAFRDVEFYLGPSSKDLPPGSGGG